MEKRNMIIRKAGVLDILSVTGIYEYIHTAEE